MDRRDDPLHFGRYIVTLGLSVFLAWKYSSGELHFYINERFFPLTLFAAILLWCLAAIHLTSSLSTSEHPVPKPKASWQYAAGVITSSLPVIMALFNRSASLIYGAFLLNAAGVFSLTRKKQRGEQPTAIRSLVASLLLVFPVVIGLSSPAQPLSSTSLDDRGVSLTATFGNIKESSQSFEVIEDDRNILDWIKLAGSAADPSVYTGQQANVVGFVYHDDRLEEGQFMLSRFVITCCVADAQAIGLPVESTQSAELSDNTWVRVQGTLDKTIINGDTVPLIQAAAIETIAAPEQPYLYP